MVKFFTGGGETNEHFIVQFCLKWFFEKILHPCTHYCVFIERGGTYSRGKEEQAAIFSSLCCALLKHSTEGIWKRRINQRILDIQNFYHLENPLKDLIHFSGKGWLCSAMHKNSHSLCIWEEYLAERSRKKAMEWDHRDREPCLSPAAFVNQVQYSNILEGRFKQLQGKSHTDPVQFHLGIYKIFIQFCLFRLAKLMLLNI